VDKPTAFKTQRNQPDGPVMMTRIGKTGTDGDFFVTVDPRNWKRLKEEEEEEVIYKCLPK
jgi:hypothetical protein